jgi:hypothetical protein
MQQNKAKNFIADQYTSIKGKRSAERKILLEILLLHLIMHEPLRRRSFSYPTFLMKMNILH